MIDFTANWPWFERIQGFREEALLACVWEPKLDAFTGLTSVCFVCVVFKSLRFHRLSSLWTVFLKIARVHRLAVEADLILTARIRVLVLPATLGPWGRCQLKVEPEVALLAEEWISRVHFLPWLCW